MHVQRVFKLILYHGLFDTFELSSLFTTERIYLRRIVKFGGILMLRRRLHFWCDLDRQLHIIVLSPLVFLLWRYGALYVIKILLLHTWHCGVLVLLTVHAIIGVLLIKLTKIYNGY